MSDESPGKEVKMRRWLPTLSLGLAAFVLSLAIALINGFYAVRGAEVVVQQPRSLLLYRDGEGDQSILVIAVRAPMINTAAAEHGDVLMNSSVTLGAGGPRFSFQSIVQPVLGGGEGEGCELLARCIRLPDLLVVEYPDAVADVAGGKAQVRTLAYGLTQSACAQASECERFQDFRSAIAQLGGKPIEAEFTLQFNEDGRRTLVCRTAPLGKDLLTFLVDVGWVNLACLLPD